MAWTAELWTPNSSTICEVAGATIDDDTGDMKVNSDTMTVEAHFFEYVQLQFLFFFRISNNNIERAKAHFFGFAGSSGPSQSTQMISDSGSFPSSYPRAPVSTFIALSPGCACFCCEAMGDESYGSEKVAWVSRSITAINLFQSERHPMYDEGWILWAPMSTGPVSYRCCQQHYTSTKHLLSRRMLSSSTHLTLVEMSNRFFPPKQLLTQWLQIIIYLVRMKPFAMW